MKKVIFYLQILIYVMCLGITSNAESCNHKWEEWEIWEEPTCGYAGYRHRSCELCGKEEYEDIRATGNHQWGNWETDEQPSCYSNGEKIRYCLVCEKSEAAIIHAYNCHQWSDWNITTVATCGYTGEQERRCLRCGEYQCEETPIDQNNHVMSDWIYFKPDALNDGEKYRECDCGKVKESIKIPKLNAIVKLNKTSLKLSRNKTYKLKIKKTTYGDYVSYWKSSNKKIVTVDKNGKAKAKKKGKATITVKMESGVKATCKVTVK